MQLSRPPGTAMLRSVQMTEYAGPDGLNDMQELVRRTWSPASRLHLGDVAWERSVNARRSSADWRTAVWRDGEDVVAWGWLEQPGHLHLTQKPRDIPPHRNQRGLF